MRNSFEEIQFVSRFTEAEWRRLTDHDSLGLKAAMSQGKEEAEAFAVGVLGYLPEKPKLSVVLPFAVA